MSNPYAKALLGKENEAATWNGDKAFKSTLSKVLDFYSRAGAIRTLSETEKVRIFTNAFAEDKLLALKALFYLRDVRGGAGERDTVRIILKHLANTQTEIIRNNLKNVVEFGRYDDLLSLFDTKVEKDVLDLFKAQLSTDMLTKEDESISLLAKWLPSENASSKISKNQAIKIRTHLGVDSRTYRKILTKLRARLRVVETDMSSGKFQNINYAQVPARASMIYRKSFKKKDEARYTSFQTKVEKGEETIKASGIAPYELVYKARNSSEDEKTLDLQWAALPNYFKDGVKAIAMADTSGSMRQSIGSGTKAEAIDVSIAMAMYMAEKNKGPFEGLFITFSRIPSLHKIQGLTLKDKYRNIPVIVENTNVLAAFELLLNVAVKNNISQDDMIDAVFVFSDMQFDSNGGSEYKSSFEVIKAKYERNGYQMPKLIFWQLNGTAGNSPVTHDEKGTALVSGFSAEIFKSVLKGNTPMDQMLEVLNSARYSSVVI